MVRIFASKLKVGDYILNQGQVVAILRVGVFVVAGVRHLRWNLADGEGCMVQTDLVLHTVDPVHLESSDDPTTLPAERKTQ